MTLSGIQNRNLRRRGLLALSPLAVFLAAYILPSLHVGDFYRIPVASAFIIASVYAILTSRGGNLQRRIATFSKGAGHPNVLLMIWIFILAGAFANSAKAIGSIEATVNLTLNFLPGRMLLAGLFIASCLVSMAVGTSVGTIAAIVPIASGISVQSGFPPAIVTSAIVGGAFFGDNLSFISDTTIAATRSLGCGMKDKFKANAAIAIPAAIFTALIYILIGSGYTGGQTSYPVDWIMVVPYVVIIALALAGMDVVAVLTIGLAVNTLIGLLYSSMDFPSILKAAGDGISGMGELITVTLLAGGMLQLIRRNGGISFILRTLTKNVSSPRGAGFSIAALVGLANLCTANNTIAIITTGQLAKEIATRFRIPARKAASILDTFSCIVQCIIPYGAQMLMAAGLTGLSAISITSNLYYPLLLAVAAVISILFMRPEASPDGNGSPSGTQPK